MKQAHGGIGASSHMACLLFTSEVQVKPNLVAYRGTGPALNDLIGGHVDFFCDQAVSVTGQILSGTVKAYAISGDKRLATLPDVPTAKELGVDYRMNIWAAIFAPKGTDKEIVIRLADALDRTLDDPGRAEAASPTSAARSRQKTSATRRNSISSCTTRSPAGRRS